LKVLSCWYWNCRTSHLL